MMVNNKTCIELLSSSSFFFKITTWKGLKFRQGTCTSPPTGSHLGGRSNTPVLPHATETISSSRLVVLAMWTSWLVSKMITTCAQFIAVHILLHERLGFRAALPLQLAPICETLKYILLVLRTHQSLSSFSDSKTKTYTWNGTVTCHYHFVDLIQLNCMLFNVQQVGKGLNLLSDTKNVLYIIFY